MENRIKSVTEEVSKELQRTFGDKVDRIILYGSYARGDFTMDSDVDIIVLLNCGQDEIKEKRKLISRIASRAGLKNDIMVSILARDSRDFRENMKSRPFYQNVEREGVEIYG